MPHCTGVLQAQLHTHRSLALRSSLVGELGSKWESSGGSSFPCASSQARSSRSFLLLARSAAGRENEQRSHSALPANSVLQGKVRQLLWLSRAPLKCSFSKEAEELIEYHAPQTHLFSFCGQCHQKFWHDTVMQMLS